MSFPIVLGGISLSCRKYLFIYLFTTKNYEMLCLHYRTACISAGYGGFMLRLVRVCVVVLVTGMLEQAGCEQCTEMTTSEKIYCGSREHM